MIKLIERSNLWLAPKMPHMKKMGKVTVAKFLLIAALVSLGFIFFYPIIYMISTAFMTPDDLVSPDVYYIPRKLFIDNFLFAFFGMNYPSAVAISFLTSSLAAIGHLISTSLVGYGFARYKSKALGILFFLVVFSFIIPPQTLIIPLYFQFSRYGWVNTYKTLIVPTFFAQGLKGALFVIVFRQFFASLPYELEDAARIDGAGHFRIFSQIMLPLSKAALIIVFLFSFVWQWNDYYIPAIFLRAEKVPISARLSGFWGALHVLRTDSELGIEMARLIGDYNVVNIWRANSEGIGMAACLMVIAVPLILYIILQRFFTESIERTGLVG